MATTAICCCPKLNMQPVAKKMMHYKKLKEVLKKHLLLE